MKSCQFDTETKYKSNTTRTILDKRRRTIQEGQQRPEEVMKFRNNEKTKAED